MNINKKFNKIIESHKLRQYFIETFVNINIIFKKNSRILDVGCGDGSYSKIFKSVYGLDTYAVDIYQHNDIKSINKLKFKIGSIFNLKFKNEFFDYVFLHDILHHIDEETQDYKKHLKAIQELKRVIKKGGKIIIIEANRYNLLFYPHMVLMRKHNHWKQSYFLKLMRDSFPDSEYSTKFKFFESHYYPFGNRIWIIYEKLIELLPIKKFHAYNLCIASKN